MRGAGPKAASGLMILTVPSTLTFKIECWRVCDGSLDIGEDFYCDFSESLFDGLQDIITQSPTEPGDAPTQ